MTSRDWDDYYSNQAGNGLSAFEGLRYQQGHGFFSTLFQNIIKPLGRYLGRQAITTGVNIGADYLKGDNLKESLKKNVKMTGRNMLEDSIGRAKKFAQTGSGKRRRRRKKAKTGLIKEGKNHKKALVKKKPRKKRKVKTKPKSKPKSKSKSKSKTKSKSKLRTKTGFSHLFKNLKI